MLIDCLVVVFLISFQIKEEEASLFDVLWLLLASVVFVPIFQKIPGGKLTFSLLNFILKMLLLLYVYVCQYLGEKGWPSTRGSCYYGVWRVSDARSLTSGEAFSNFPCFEPMALGHDS